MSAPRMSTVALLALVCVLSADGVLIFVRQRLWHEAARLPETRIWQPRAEAVPSGFLANGLTYGPAATKARCFALLFTSAYCGFCSMQQPEWRMLVTRARDLDCDALRVAPERIEEAPLGSAQTLGRELVFLSPGWASGSPPTLTPTLMIFVRGAATAWCHVGELDAGSAASAFAALDSAARARRTPQGSETPSDGRMVCRR